jgi:hypothetical protein
LPLPIIVRHGQRSQPCGANGEIARIGLTTFDRAVADKRLQVHRIGRKIMVKREELNRSMRTE